jgi:hypothetical protein
MRHLRSRLIALTLFWSPVAYITVAVFGSIMVELYSRKPQHSTKDWCIGRLVGLKTELDRYLQVAIKDPKASEKDWPRRFSQAQKLCPQQSQAYTQLFSVYQGYTRALATLHHTQSDELSALDDMLKQLEK